jgi:hypothetical protein
MLVIILLILATVAIGFVPGLALFAIIPGLLLVAYAAWLLLTAASGRTPGTAVRSRGRRAPELLGPGGPDDPDR